MSKSYLILDINSFKNEKVLSDKDIRAYVYETPFSHELSVIVAASDIEPRIFESNSENDKPLSLIPHIGDILILLSVESVSEESPYLFKGNVYNDFQYIQKNTGNSIHIWVDSENNLKIEKIINEQRDYAFNKIAFDLSYMLLNEHGIDVLMSDSYKFSSFLTTEPDTEESSEEKEEMVEEPAPRKVTVEEAKEVENQLENLINKDYSKEEKKEEDKD